MMSTTLRRFPNNVAVNADGLLVDWNGQPIANEPYLGMVHIGDLHMPRDHGSLMQTDEAAAIAQFVASITTIIAKRDLWKVRLALFPGDLVDSSNPDTAWNNVIIPQFNRLIAAGIYPAVCPGNHETGSTRIYWDRALTLDYFKQNPYWTKITNTNSTSTGIYTIQNGPLKIAIIACDSPSTGQGAWITSAARMYPNHQCIVMIHRHVDSSGYYDISDTVAAIKAEPNIFMVVGGHYRMPFNCAHSFDVSDHGRTITNIFMNNQQMYDTGNNYIRLYKFFQDHVEASTYDNYQGRFLVNGETAPRASALGMELGYYQNFQFPIFGYGKPQLGDILPQFVQNVAFNTVNGALSTAGISMNETIGQVILPYAAIAANGTPKTWSLVTNETKPRFAAS